MQVSEAVGRDYKSHKKNFDWKIICIT
jgi:hypothetical protein